MRREEKADVGGKLESAKKCDKKGEKRLSAGSKWNFAEREREMETRLKEIATGQKLNLKREQKNTKIVTQLIKLDALKTRRFTNKIITNYSPAKSLSREINSIQKFRNSRKFYSSKFILSSVETMKNQPFNSLTNWIKIHSKLLRNSFTEGRKFVRIHPKR